MHYLWLDLETTGLDPYSDSILEVGLTITDDRLDEKIGGRRFLLAPSDSTWCSRLGDDVLDMHVKSGLIHDLDDPFHNFLYGLLTVERNILSLIEPWLEDGKIVLAGSGVGTFDLAFIREQMPELAQRLTYYVLDVGVVRRFLRDICQVEIPDQGPVEHRALSDVMHHLDEARAFRTARHNVGAWSLAS